jgi:hypothetical protein
MIRELSWKLSQLRSHVLFTVTEGIEDAVFGTVLPNVGSTAVLSFRSV